MNFKTWKNECTLLVFILNSSFHFPFRIGGGKKVCKIYFVNRFDLHRVQMGDNGIRGGGCAVEKKLHLFQDCVNVCVCMCQYILDLCVDLMTSFTTKLCKIFASLVSQLIFSRGDVITNRTISLYLCKTKTITHTLSLSCSLWRSLTSFRSIDRFMHE